MAKQQKGFAAALEEDKKQTSKFDEPEKSRSDEVSARVSATQRQAEERTRATREAQEESDRRIAERQAQLQTEYDQKSLKTLTNIARQRAGKPTGTQGSGNTASKSYRSKKEQDAYVEELLSTPEGRANLQRDKQYARAMDSLRSQLEGSKTAIEEEEKRKAFTIDTTAEKEALRKQMSTAASLEETQQLREDLRQSYEQDISGQGPSLANAQLRAVQERSLSDQLAQAQASRPTSAAGLQQALQRQQQAATQELTRESIQAGVGERNQLEQALAAMTSEDQRLVNQMEQSYLQQGFSAELARQASAADLERMNAQRYLMQQGASVQSQMLNMQAQQARSARQQAFIGNAFSAVGEVGGALAKRYSGNTKGYSDKTAKTKIKKASNEDVSKALAEKASKKDTSIKKDFLDKLKAYTYEYKDNLKDNPKAGSGKQFSVMAQDLEKAGKIGKSMVTLDPETGYKMVDYAKGFGAILAAQAHLNERLNSLEKKKKPKDTQNGRKK